jgi:uncharacterized protein YegP (UPF0339 family)
MVRPIRADVVPASKGRYRFRFIAGNGKVLAVSESYARKRKAREALRTIIEGVGSMKIIINAY